MKIQSNSRQVPSVEKYTADKQYHDILYGVLQELSYGEKYPGDDHMTRYVNKKDFTFVSLAQRLNMDRNVVSSKFKNLIKLGLLEEDKELKRYKLAYLDGSIATLVPFETLRTLNNTLNHNAISIYVYLLKRFIAAGEQEYIYTRNQLKTFIGIATNTTSNDDTIADIIKVLKLLGLIETRCYTDENNKTHTYITRVTNQIKKVDD